MSKEEIKIGDEVYYVKESYGIHTILDFNEKSEVLLSTPKLIGEGVSKFWTDINRIKPKQRG
jgi:hypothetical protein